MGVTFRPLPMSAPSTRVQFGAFELDLTTGELRSTDAAEVSTVLLREQVFQVLQMLVEHPGQIVTREEIRSRLWANDTIVDFDHSINAAIKALRRALGDSADSPKYIETLARRGYRLMLPINYLESADATVLEKDREQSATGMTKNAAGVRVPRGWKAALVLVCAFILIAAGYISRPHFAVTAPPTSQKIMLAVLPFENLTGDPSKDYLADGLTEQTISQLGRLDPKQLGVIARTSVMGYKHKDERLDQIGRDLSVQYVLENSLRENGDQMRLTAQLIQVKDQTHLWSKDYDYPAKDIVNVEDDVARAVAQEIQLQLTSQQQADLTQPHSVNPEAFDAYLQGHYFLQRDSDKDISMAAKYFERATQLDPSFASAWVGLSRVRKWQANRGLIPTDQGYRLAREAVERALALNPNLAAAHVQMGRIKQQVDFDWAGADASFQRAGALDPNDPDSLGLAAFSAAMFARFDQALPLIRRAVDLDPLDGDAWELLAEIECFAGQLDRAAADSEKGLELTADAWPGPILLSEIYVMQGRPQNALPEVERIKFDDMRAAKYAIAYHALGRKKDSDAALSELITKYHAIAAYQIVEVYAFRNQLDEAFEWLDRAYAQHDDGLIGTKADPLLKNLRNDPRYASFLKKLNMPA